MLEEYIVPVTMILTSAIGYVIAKKAVTKGIWDAYSAIVEDISSPETQNQLKTMFSGIGRSAVGGATGSVKMKDVFPLIALGVAQKIFPGLGQMMQQGPQQGQIDVIPPSNQDTNLLKQ